MSAMLQQLAGDTVDPEARLVEFQTKDPQHRLSQASQNIKPFS